MDLLTIKIIAMVIVGIVPLFFGLLPLKFKNWIVNGGKNYAKIKRRERIISGLLCFGAGVLLATVFLHILPEVREGLGRAQHMKEEKLSEAQRFSGGQEDLYDKMAEAEMTSKRDDQLEMMKSLSEMNDPLSRFHENENIKEKMEEIESDEPLPEPVEPNFTTLEPLLITVKPDATGNSIRIRRHDLFEADHTENHSHDPGQDHFHGHENNHPIDSDHQEDHSHDHGQEHDPLHEVGNRNESHHTENHSHDEVHISNQKHEHNLPNEDNHPHDLEKEQDHFHDHSHEPAYPNKSDHKENNSHGLGERHNHDLSFKTGHKEDHPHDHGDEHAHHNESDHEDNNPNSLGDEHNHDHSFKVGSRNPLLQVRNDPQDTGSKVDQPHDLEQEDHYLHSSKMDPDYSFGLGQDEDHPEIHVDEHNHSHDTGLKHNHGHQQEHDHLHEHDHSYDPKHKFNHNRNHGHGRAIHYDHKHDQNENLVHSNENQRHDHFYEHDGTHEHSHDHDYPYPELIICIGFFLIYSIEEIVHKIFSKQSHGHGHGHGQGHSHFSPQTNGKANAEENLANGHSHITFTNGRKAKATFTSSTNDVSEISSNGKYSKTGHDNLAFSPDVEFSYKSPAIMEVTTFQNTNDGLDVPDKEIAQPITKQQSSSSSKELSSKIVIQKLRSLIVILALSIHGIFEGMIIGLQENEEDVWYLTFAIVAHHFIISFCISMEMIVDGVPTILVIIYVFLLSIVQPLGAALGLIVTEISTPGPEHEFAVAILSGLAGGTILYVIYFEIMERERNKEGSKLIKLLTFIIGFAFMAILEIFSSHSHGPMESGHLTH